MDDFNDWSETDGCCKYFKDNGTFCPHNLQNSGTLCSSCEISTTGLNTTEYFLKYFPFFLNDNPDANCAKGGHAAYAGVLFTINFKKVILFNAIYLKFLSGDVISY